MDYLPRAPTRQNGATLWEPFSGRLYDTQSNVNYYPGPTLRFYNDSTQSIELTKRIIRDVRSSVLESMWHNDIYPYVVVEGGAARLVRSKEEYNSQCKNIYKDFDAKTDFLKDHFATKKQLRHDLERLFKKVVIPNEMAQFETVVLRYLKRRTKKRIIEAVKEGMKKK